MLIFEILIFSFTFWLGAYLISRNPGDVRLILTGSGLTAYAIAIAISIISIHGDNSNLSNLLSTWQFPILILPAVFWLLLLIHLLRGDESWYSRLQNHKNPLIVVLTATIFFGLGIALLIFPLEWLSRNLLLIGIGLDLLMLGAAVAFLDAFDEGESLLPHMSRSFLFATFLGLIFGGQIVLVIILSTGVSSSMLTLLLGVIAAAILLQTFNASLQRGLDNIVLFKSPDLVETKATLRETAAGASRYKSIDLSQLDEKSFTRLTRRALSQMGNIPRLAANPLTHLPIINEKVGSDDNPIDTLQRATELRSVLAESINRLKPDKDGQFGTSDQWRHFNALYYPYVVGLKPYSRRGLDSQLDEDTKQVLQWFRKQVPQRTLYNWQNSAAHIVAQDLRERSWPARSQPYSQPEK